MAEFILKDMVNKRGTHLKFYIDSAATSNYNELHNEGMHEGTKNILKEMNIPFNEHISRHLKKEDYDKFDFILAMEEKNIPDILNIIKIDKNNKVFKLLDFTKTPKDIADPWYTGNFHSTYYDISYGCEKFLEYIEDKSEKNI